MSPLKRKSINHCDSPSRDSKRARVSHSASSAATALSRENLEKLNALAAREDGMRPSSSTIDDHDRPRTPSDSISRTSVSGSSIYSVHSERGLEAAGIKKTYKSNAPTNEAQVRQDLERSRASMSPPMSPSRYRKFRTLAASAENESKVHASLLPHFMPDPDKYGPDSTAFNVGYSNMAPIASGLKPPKPDVLEGIDQDTIHSELRDRLGPYILPLPATGPGVINFTTELKGAAGIPIVGQRQIRYNNSVGARAIDMLNSYESSTTYDRRPTAFGADLTNANLDIYGTHVEESSHGGPRQYHTNLLASISYLDSPESLHKAKRYFRNSREMAFRERQAAVERATARTLSSRKRRAVFTASNNGISVNDGDTDDDDEAEESFGTASRDKKDDNGDEEASEEDNSEAVEEDDQEKRKQDAD